MSSQLWTEEQVEFLKANYATMRNRALSEATGKSISAIERKARRLGLTGSKEVKWTPELKREVDRRRKAEKYVASPRPEWSDEDIAFLKANWRTMTTKQLSEHLKRSQTPIRRKAERLGLGAKPMVRIPGVRTSRMHPKAEKPRETTAAQITAAWDAMKRKPGPLALGWRVRSIWR